MNITRIRKVTRFHCTISTTPAVSRATLHPAPAPVSPLTRVIARLVSVSLSASSRTLAACSHTFSTVHHSTEQYGTVQYSTVQYSTVTISVFFL